MPNKSNEKAAGEFIEDVARQLTPLGVPAVAARLYGYLLLAPEPVSLDAIAADLQVARSTAFVAARLLEQYMLARRIGQRGTKRVLYEASDNYEAMLVAQNRLLENLAEVFDRGSGVAAAPARERLVEVAEFYRVIRRAMDEALEAWRAARR
ncbi:GbsR/MarR family transcriptional regulator [Phenylobacterium sp.]|uniref:GbsR/MarR family transcriptional regulator n=1 Tax=Phenylobacterium sp. TaxID=1871053 RepID=UPI0035B06FD5